MAVLILCVGKLLSEPSSSLVSVVQSLFVVISLPIVGISADNPISRPDFDSPSVFCRLLDKDKGGYFTISPPSDKQYTTKQQYLPSSNILQTRYIHEEGVVDLVDFFPRPRNSLVVTKTSKQMPFREGISVQDELKKWLVRRVECIRGKVDLGEPLPGKCISDPSNQVFCGRCLVDASMVEIPC